MTSGEKEAVSGHLPLAQVAPAPYLRGSIAGYKAFIALVVVLRRLHESLQLIIALIKERDARGASGPRLFANT